MPHRIALRGRPDQLYIYSGRSVLITDTNGEVRGQSSQGLHVDNTRMLSEDYLRIGAEALRRVSVSPVGATALLGYYLLPAIGDIQADSVFAEVMRFVEGGLSTRIRISNYARRGTAHVPLEWCLAADFADTDDTERGQTRVQIPTEDEWDADHQELTFRSTHPEFVAASILALSGAHGRWDGSSIHLDLEIPARESADLSLTVDATVDGRSRRAPTTRFESARSRLAGVRSSLVDESVALRSSNATVERAWATAVADLATLPLGLDDAPAAPMAGLPLYQQFFGRDTLTIGWQSLLAMQSPLRDALRANAERQGTTIDDWLDEEPGKMIHQARWGPVSRLAKDPFSRYYGDWATVPDFLVMLGQYLAWTADFDTVRSLLPAARRAVTWLERYADLDRDGFVEYRTRSTAGVKNQGWLDSDDAIVDDTGEIVPNPIATSELQAYTYAGLQQAGLVFAACGDVGYGIELLAWSRRLKARFDAAFWVPELGCYAMGLGPGGEPIRSVASNSGHLLAGGLAPPERGRTVARRLMQPDMFSGWGIRTLSADHPFFNPFSYHRGSVWPVEQATIGFGFARYGAWAELDRLAGAFFDTTELFDEGRLPEVVGGIQRDAEHPHPGVYPDSCEPQGWSASAVIQMIQAILGMVAVAPARLLVVDPHLPPWLPDLSLEGVRVGSAKFDIKFQRAANGQTRWRTTHRRGTVAVIRQPPPQSAEATLAGRAKSLIASPLGR